MHIKSIVAGAAIAIALAAAVGSTYAAERFATLEGIAAQPLTALEMVAVHGTGNPHDTGTPPGSIDISAIGPGAAPPGIFDIVFTAPDGFPPPELIGCPACPLPTP